MNTLVLELLKELRNHTQDKQDVIEEKISQRLNKSLLSYSDELDDSYEYLYYRDSLNLLKKLTKKG